MDYPRYLLVFGAVFHSSSFFDKELITTGSFKYARHPMYVAIYIMLLGVGFLFFSEVWFAIMVVFIPI